MLGPYLFILAHELGHAFGLSDAYIHGTQPSTGGLAATGGKQPSSIMAMVGLPGAAQRQSVLLTSRRMTRTVSSMAL